MHPTKIKADLAMSKVISSLIELEYQPLLPFSDHLPFDIVAMNDTGYIKLQVKYLSSERPLPRNITVNKNHSQYKTYCSDDFDYYAIYLSKIDKVIYPSITLIGQTIYFEELVKQRQYYWYADFLTIQNVLPVQRTNFLMQHKDYKPRKHIQKIVWPTDEELQTLLWSKPLTSLSLQLGVTDTAIKKMAKRRNLTIPPKGFWLREVNRNVL